MIEEWKEYMKNNSSNGPKAKILIGVAVLVIILSVTFINMRKTVTMEIDGKEETFVTYKGIVKDVLGTNGVGVNPKDKVQPALNSKVFEEDTTPIKRAVSVELIVEDKQVKIDTTEDTIEEMLEVEEELKNQGIESNEGLDETTPALNTKTTSSLKINFVKVEARKELAKEAIDFNVAVETDANLDSRLEEVRQDGTSGEKEVTYEIVYKSGEEFSKAVRSPKVVAEPVNKVVAQGARETFVSRDGQLLNYKSVIYCEFTAYSGGGVAAIGAIPVRNPNSISTIAADPRVIPLGSLVCVEGYGRAVAADAGGIIKGNIVDVHVNSEAEAYNN